MCVLSYFSHVQLFATLWTSLWLARLLCPWDFPGKNTGVGCHALLQRIFPTEGSNMHVLSFLHCRRILYPLSHWGSPKLLLTCVQTTFPNESTHLQHCHSICIQQSSISSSLKQRYWSLLGLTLKDYCENPNVHRHAWETARRSITVVISLRWQRVIRPSGIDRRDGVLNTTFLNAAETTSGANCQYIQFNEGYRADQPFGLTTVSRHCCDFTTGSYCLNNYILQLLS